MRRDAPTRRPPSIIFLFHRLHQSIKRARRTNLYATFERRAKNLAFDKEGRERDLPGKTRLTPLIKRSCKITIFTSVKGKRTLTFRSAVPNAIRALSFIGRAFAFH